MRILLPGIGLPTEPTLKSVTRLTVMAALVSDQPVALVDAQSHTAIEVTQPRAERCAAGDRRVALATEGGA